MDWNKELYNDGEKPLDKLADGYSHTAIFRRMAFIGDSLSSGEFETRDGEGKAHYHDMFPYSWGQFVARKNGLEGFNFSRGGMTAQEYLQSFAQAQGYWDPDKACQAYVIALGVNDILNRKMEIGSVADIDPTDWRKNKPTFLGNYAAIVSRYKEISPDAKFFFVSFPNERDQERTLAVLEGLTDLANHFDNAYLIDLYHYGPVYDEQFKERFFLYGHMNPSGYLFTARLIDSYIDYIIRHNYDDFRTVGFIGTDIPYKLNK